MPVEARERLRETTRRKRRWKKPFESQRGPNGLVCLDTDPLVDFRAPGGALRSRETARPIARTGMKSQQLKREDCEGQSHQDGTAARRVQAKGSLWETPRSMAYGISSP